MAPAVPAKKHLLRRSLAIAAGLTLLKAAMGFSVGSMSLVASAADSLFDFVISLANYIFVYHAAKPADADHAYGHGKIESLAGLLQGVVIGAVGLSVLAGAVFSFLHPQPLEKSWQAVAVALFAMGLNAWHVSNLRRCLAGTGSPLMAAEYAHYASDVLGHLGVVASLMLWRWTGQAFWDPLMSLVIVVYLLWSVGGIFRRALSELMDEQLPEAELRSIEGLIRDFNPKIAGYRDLRTRKVSDTKFIEFHVELRDVREFQEAHAISEGLVDRLKSHYPGAVVTVHAHPISS